MRRNRLNVMMKHHETLNLRINTKQHTKSILMSINKWNSLNYFYDKTEKKHTTKNKLSVLFSIHVTAPVHQSHSTDKYCSTDSVEEYTILKLKRTKKRKDFRLKTIYELHDKLNFIKMLFGFETKPPNILA